MAIVKFGVLVIGVRGTIGGATYSANGSGPFVKAWAKGSNPRSPIQTDQRLRVAEQSQGWRALTSLQQAAWDAFAALPAQDLTDSLGQTFSASGFNWYTKVNTRLLIVGRPVRTAPPVLPRPANPTILALTLRSSPFFLESLILYPSMEFNTFDLVLKLWMVNSVGRQVRASNFKLLVATTSPGMTQQEFKPELEEAFGTIQIGQFGFAQVFRQTTDGLRSSATAVSDDVNV